MFTPFSVTGCSLELLKPREQGIVTFYRTQDYQIIEKIISMGITIGTYIKLEQQFPVLVIKIQGQNISISPKIARAIYVRILAS